MTKRLATVTLLVHDYDAAIAWYCAKLSFSLIEDTPLSETKRWVLIGFDGAAATRLLLAKADGEAQVAQVGCQAGGRVFLFLETGDFARDHARMLADGVIFNEAPRIEPYGTVAVFKDLYGNLWDLIEPRPTIPT